VIRILRDRQVAGQPIQPQGNWIKNAEKAERRAVADGASHQVGDLYRAPEVKRALEELFHRKCAYCETPLAEALDGWDVEHFRPKGEVEGRSDHPGYYWLAYRWTNLYPSCRLCNQNRRDPATYRDPTTGPAAGKDTQFPLADEATRAMNPDDDLAREDPLLLDPCDPSRDPERYLLYNAKGEIFPSPTGGRRAEATIQVFHLTRKRLREARELVVRRAVKVLDLRQEVRGRFDAGLLQKIDAVLDELVADSASFAAAARCVVRDPTAFLPL
jgi:uncharacterized protein (TIGR02646 family)